MKRIFPIGAALLICSAAAMAQYTNVLENGTEQTVTNTWSTDTVWVGENTPSNALYIVSGGVATSTNAYVGANAGASNNLVSVTGSGSWTIEDTLEIGIGTGNVVSVGSGGSISVGDLVLHSGNELNLNSGGTFAIATNFNASTEGFIWENNGTLAVQDGNLSGIVGLGGTNKTLVIDGGSWSNSTSDIYIGINGTGNQLTVTNGAQVTSTSGYIGYGLDVDTNYTGAVLYNGNVISNNSATVSGTLTVINGYTVYDPYDLLGGGTTLPTNGVPISSNELIVITAGTNLVAVDYDYVDASENSVLVSGSNSSWNISNDLIVGAYGSGNSLVIDDGGTVSNATGYIGFGSIAENNSVAVSGSGSRWMNSGGSLYVGSAAGSGSSLTVSNEAWVYVGEATTNDIDIVAGADGGILVASTNGAVMLVDNDSSVQTTGGLYIGGTNAAVTGSVTITNGSTVEAQSLVIGNDGSSLDIENEGTLSITGNYDYDAQKANVNWNSGGTLSVGGTLTKSNGLDGVNRTLVVKGEDAGWAPGGDLTVSGTNNTLSIVDGAAVTNDNGYVGYNTGESNNTVSVSGADSVWENNGNLYIGTNTSAGNTVTVSDGGRIEADDLVIEDGNSFSLDSGGTLAISGAFNIAQQTNLIWDAGGLLSLSGELRGLPTTNLAVNGMTNDYGYINGGHDIDLNGGSLPLGTTNLIVGYLSSGSDLSITNGATVVNADGYIGWGGSSANNSVLVSGSGSTWTNAGGDLYVGAYWSDTNLVNAGSGNTLTVEDDAWVNVGEVQTNLAGGSMLVASTNGAQLVVGNGTVNVEGTLYLGRDTNTTGIATIRNGGTVSAGTLEIADGSLLDLRDGGTLAMTGGFNLAPQTNLVWNPGGELSVGGILSGMDTTNLVVGGATNTAYYLDGGRDLTLDGGTWDISGTNLVVGYGSSGSDLVIKNTGTLFSATTYIGWDTNSANNTVTVRDGSTWTNSGDLWVGYGGDGSLLTIFNAGTNSMTGNALIGNTNTANSQVRVEGTNSLWDVGGDLFIGNGSNSVGHLLEVSDAAEVLVGGDLTVNTGNTLSLDSGGSIEAGNMNVYSNTFLTGSGTIRFGTNDSVLAFSGTGIFISTNLLFDGGLVGDNTVSVDDGSFTVSATTSSQYVNFQTLELNGTALEGFGTVDAFDSIDMTGGVIDPKGENIDTAQLTIGGTFTVTNGTVYQAQVYETRNDELVFTGDPVNLDNMAIDVLVVTAPGAPVIIMSGTNGLSGTFFETSLVDRLLLYNAVLEITSTNVQISLEADPLESSMEFAATEMIRAGFGGMQNAVFTRTKQLRRNLVSTAHAIPNETYLLTNTNAPAGAMGPGDQNTIFDMHVWLQQYSGQGDFDSRNASDGFTLNNHGTTIGADRLVGEALTLGFNYTYARSSARTTGMDTLDSETYWIGAYGEWVGEEGLYVDAMAAYGRSNYDSKRSETNYLGTASYRGQAFGAYADVGQYYHSGELALSPYAGIRVLTILADGHNETEALGSSVYVDEVSRDLVESAIGLKARHRFDTRIGRFQTTGYAEWAHDFIEDDVSARLTAEGFPTVGTGAISPDADTVNVGLGYSWISTDYMEVGIGYTGRFSENYEEHAGSLMLDIMF